MTFKEEVINASKKEDFYIKKITDTRDGRVRKFNILTVLEGRTFEMSLELTEHVKYTVEEFAKLIESVTRGHLSRERFNGNS